MSEVAFKRYLIGDLACAAVDSGSADTKLVLITHGGIIAGRPCFPKPQNDAEDCALNKFVNDGYSQFAKDRSIDLSDGADTGCIVLRDVDLQCGLYKSHLAEATVFLDQIVGATFGTIRSDTADDD